MTGLAACGDDDEGPTKAEYIENADVVCAEADVKVDDIFRAKLNDETDPKKLQEGIKALLPEERKLLSELRALEKPEGEQDEIDRIWAARERAVDGLEAAGRTPAGASAYDASEPEGWDEAARLASEYGMVDCEATQPGSVAG